MNPEGRPAAEPPLDDQHPAGAHEGASPEATPVESAHSGSSSQDEPRDLDTASSEIVSAPVADVDGGGAEGSTAEQLIEAGEPAEIVRVQPADITTLEMLLTYAYQEGGKKLTAPKAIYEKIDRGTPHPLETEPCYPLVEELAVNDPLLAVPIRLLVHAEDGAALTQVRRRITDCMAYALRLHRVFVSESLQDALWQRPGVDVDRAFETLRAAVERIPSAESTKVPGALKDNERSRLLANATTSLAMILAQRGGWRVDQLVDCLYRNLWTVDSATPRSFRPRAAIADSRTPDVLAAVAQVFDRRVANAAKRIAELERQYDQIMQRATAADQQLEERSREVAVRDAGIAALEERVAQLEATINEERRNRLVDESHHLDDYEMLRTRVVRLLDKQADLLRDGLHALRNDRPAIADEFVERALDAFDRERQQLKDLGGSN